MIFLLFLTGCLEPLVTEIQLTGILTEHRFSDAEPVQGTVTTLTHTAEEYDCIDSSEDGSFNVQAPANAPLFFVHTDADGRTPTSFAGWSGIDDLEVAPGTLWVRSEVELEAIRADFANCAESQDEGAIIEGEVRVYLPVEDSIDDLPLVTTASLVVEDENETVRTACYLDDDGLSDPDASVTGTTGRFAIFGLNSGPHVLTVLYDIGSDLVEESTYPILLPENGTAPMYPVLVELP